MRAMSEPVRLRRDEPSGVPRGSTSSNQTCEEGSMSRILCALVAVVVACGCGGGQSEAIKRGVGSECNADLKCTEMGQVCLTEFAGGYCGVSGCVHDTDCPGGSACVTDDNQTNYCFLICVDKVDCNPKR